MPQPEDARRAGSQLPDAAVAVLHSWLESGLVPGLAAVVARDGLLLGEFYGGLARPPRHGPLEQEPLPVLPTTSFFLDALSCAYVACLALGLVEDGLLALDEPLEDLLPELPAEDREQQTLRHLLIHSGGLPFDLGPEEWERIGPAPSLADIVEQLSRLRTVYPPGSQVRFSSIGPTLLARLAERVRGEPFGEQLRRRICEPLGLVHTALPPPPESWEQLAMVAETGAEGAPNEPYNSAWWRGLGLPAVGVAAPAREVARFLTSVLAERPPAGFLSAVTLESMTHAQSGELSGGMPDLSYWPRAEWAFGFEVRGEKRLHPFGELTSPETFGHLGWSGSMAWADPDNGLVCVVLTNRGLAADRSRRLAGFCRFSNVVAAALGA